MDSFYNWNPEEKTGTRDYNTSLHSVISATMFITYEGNEYWIGKNKSEINECVSTAIQISHIIYTDDINEKRAYQEYVSANKEKINSIYNFLIEDYQNKVCENDFDWNVYNQLFNEEKTLRSYCTSIGIAAYAIWKSINSRIEKKFTNRKASEYVGKIGEKVELDVTVYRIVCMDTKYGTSELVLMKDQNHNSIKTFYSGSKIDWEIDRTYTIKGTVKNHDMYKEVKQTQLTRVSLR